jgi:dephospho-CoA kinase
MCVIGLTGNIACGKTTVSDALKQKHGVKIIDADKIAHD